eukprot:11582597-Heterocapsa_arctica.AAC.1
MRASAHPGRDVLVLLRQLDAVDVSLQRLRGRGQLRHSPASLVLLEAFIRHDAAASLLPDPIQPPPGSSQHGPVVHVLLAARPCPGTPPRQLPHHAVFYTVPPVARPCSPALCPSRASSRRAKAPVVPWPLQPAACGSPPRRAAVRVVRLQ